MCHTELAFMHYIQFMYFSFTNFSASRSGIEKSIVPGKYESFFSCQCHQSDINFRTELEII